MITYNKKQIIKIALPLVFGLMVQVLVGLTDTAFLGRVGEVELGAAAIGGVFYMLVFIVSQSFCVGAQIIMARRNGEKRLNKIAHVFYQSLNTILLFSAASVVLTYQFAPRILEKNIANQAVCSAILAYLLPRCIGLFFSGTKSVFRAFFIATTQTTQLLPAALILLITNFIFDYLFIFGFCGIEPMGLKGAAIASILAEGCSVLYLTGYLFLKINLKKYGFNKFILWSQSLFVHIFRLSVWIIFQNILNWGTWLYFFIEIEKLGANELAISNILRSISALPFVISGALATTTSSIVSNLIGAGKDHEVIPTAWRIIRVSAIPFCLCFLFMGLFPELFLRIYTNNASLIKEAIYPLYAVLFTYLLTLPAMIYFYCIYGTGKTQVALVIEIVCTVAYLLSVGLVVGYFKLDLIWCWMTELPYYIILWGASYWYIKRQKWCCEII